MRATYQHYQFHVTGLPIIFFLDRVKMWSLLSKANLPRVASSHQCWNVRRSLRHDLWLEACWLSVAIRLKVSVIIIIIGIQPLGRSGQRPEIIQATGMALVRCILGKFLGVACHCFPPLFRRSHFLPPGASTSATTWEIPAAEVGTVGEDVVR